MNTKYCDMARRQRGLRRHLMFLVLLVLTVGGGKGLAETLETPFSPLTAAPDAGQVEFDWNLYAQILHDYVRPDHRDYMDANFVDYAALRQDKRWPVLLDSLSVCPQSLLQTPAARMAFFLNAYNILAMDKVMQNWPLKRLKSLGSMMAPVWTHPAGRLAQQDYTLREVEHSVLRAMGDPRIHFAINCASMSCPDLGSEPYNAAQLDSQLDSQTRKFLLQENKGLNLESDRVWVSSLFLWFADDFGGKAGVKQFLRKYRPDLPEDFQVTGYIPYNWDINAKLSASELRRLRD